MNKKEKHLVICLCYIALLTLDSHKNLLKKNTERGDYSIPGWLECIYC